MSEKGLIERQAAETVQRLRAVADYNEREPYADTRLDAVDELREAADLIDCWVGRWREQREALERIANGDGYYGAQAREYKQIARAALGKEAG